MNIFTVATISFSILLTDKQFCQCFSSVIIAPVTHYLISFLSDHYQALNYGSNVRCDYSLVFF